MRSGTWHKTEVSLWKDGASYTIDGELLAESSKLQGGISSEGYIGFAAYNYDVKIRNFKIQQEFEKASL